LRSILLRKFQERRLTPQLAVMAALAALAMLVRAPFNSNVGVDEAFYLVIGRQWLDGSPLYAGSLDVKPPLLFLLMALAEAVFGPALFAAKALSTAAVAATSCGLYLFGRAFFGGLAGAVAAILYIFSGLNLGGTFSPAELVMAPFTTFGMLAGAAAFFRRGRAADLPLLTSGLLFGAAACIKQTALFEALAFALAWFFAAPEKARWRTLGCFAAGLYIVPSGFALYFAAIGHFGDFIGMAAISAFQRPAASDVPPWSQALLRMAFELILVFPVGVMAALFWAARGTIAPGRGSAVLPFVAAWTAGTLTGLISARALIDFYALTALQPLCLTAGMFAGHTLGRFQYPIRRWAWRLAAIGASLYFFAWSASSLYFVPGETLTASEAAASVMRQAGLGPDDRILVADRDLILYVSARADPPGAIFHPLQLLCDFPLPGAETAFADSLNGNPAFIAVADPAFKLNCERPERRAMLQVRLASDYCRLGRFGSVATRGKPGAFVLYGLRKRLAASGRLRCEPNPTAAAL
jgi:Dolichyl-phosphate-mannose-protein mannosyltransferase